MSVLTATVALFVVFTTSGCGTERSTAAYCDKYESGFDRIKDEHPDVDQYTHTKENPVVLLMGVASAYGDIVALIGDMAKVAPDDIETDTQRVHDTLQKQLDSAGGTAGDALSGDAGGVLGGLASNLAGSITNAGAFDRMDAYVVEHCGGKHMFTVSPQ